MFPLGFAPPTPPLGADLERTIQALEKGRRPAVLFLLPTAARAFRFGAYVQTTVETGLAGWGGGIRHAYRIGICQDSQLRGQNSNLRISN